MSLTVINPAGSGGVQYADGITLTNNLSGKQGEQLNSDLHGKWYNANVRKGVFTLTVENFSIPSIPIVTTGTNGVVGVFTLQNPAGSGVNAEIISTSVGHAVATVVVNGYGWYGTSTQAGGNASASTKAAAFTNFFCNRIGDGTQGQIVPYTSYTYSSTSANTLFYKVDHVANAGATTDTTISLIDKLHDGRLILPPGSVISLGVNAAASVASANAQVTWAEWPFS